MKSHAFRTAACALLAVITAESGMAFELLDPPRRWFPSADTPRQLLVDDSGLNGVNDGNGGVNAAIGAANAWNAAGGATDVINATPSSSATSDIALGDGVSHMVFADPYGVCERTCLAATFTGYIDTNQTGSCNGVNVVKIDDSDIVFNTDPGFGPFRIGWTSEAESDGCSNETYIETVTSHEVGHLIGLGHEDDIVALMNSSVGSCDNKPILVDDVEGHDALYTNCDFDSSGPSCGDGSCDVGVGETAVSCAADCTACEDGIVSGDEVCELGDTLSCSSLGYDDDGSLATCSNCEGWDTQSCTSCTVTETSCNDSVDNDCDGLVDDADSDCFGLPVGAACTVDSDCASGKCKGRRGAKTCK